MKLYLPKVMILKSIWYLFYIDLNQPCLARVVIFAHNALESTTHSHRYIYSSALDLRSVVDEICNFDDRGDEEGRRDRHHDHATVQPLSSQVLVRVHDGAA